MNCYNHLTRIFHNPKTKFKGNSIAIFALYKGEQTTKGTAPKVGSREAEVNGWNLLTTLPG